MLSTALLLSAALVAPSLAFPTTTQPASGVLVLGHDAPPCASFHGRVGARVRTPLHYLDAECAASAPQYRGAPFSWEAGSLLWARDSDLDESVMELAARKAEIAADLVALEHQQQVTFGHNYAPRLVLELPGGEGKLMQFATDSHLLEWTSRPEYSFTELVAISEHPLPSLPSFSSSSSAGDGGAAFIGGELVPKRDVDRVAAHLKDLKFSPLLSTLLESFPKANITQDVRYLSGEDQSLAADDTERWHTRHSMSEGGAKASAWLLQRFREYGFVCEQLQFRPGFAPMVECFLYGTGDQPGKESNETVIIGAHFDSRGSFGYPTAPGADDDGSGTALILAIARHIYEHRLSFSRKVVIAAFDGEEQGLLGSNFYARRLKEQKEDVVLFIQADMIGYRVPGQPLQLARPDLIGLPVAAYLVGNVSEIYVPELQVGYTTACCSDHQSFEQQGYASTWVFEINGAIRDPCYHNSCDLSARTGYDFDQIHATSKVVLATLLEVAGFSFD